MSSVSRQNMLRLQHTFSKVDLALVVFVGLLFSTLFYNSAQRVGDGSEYYALYLAIKNHHVPWMTAGAYADYNLLYTANEIKGLVTTDQLRDSFPALILGDTADFNHFWFYSLPPALFSRLFELVGIKIAIQQAFLMWHALLLLIPMALAYRARGTLGLAVVIVLTTCSPMIWFADKVHTEFFTYSLALCTIILVSDKRLVAASLYMAIAATQNPSFAILAFILLLMRGFSLRSNKLDARELIAAVAVCLIVAIHPIYYFSRFGVITPQLLAGGAKIGGRWSDSYIWLLDPDIGLFPNWPLGFAVLLAFVFLFIRLRREKIFTSYSFFIAAYLLVNLFAQSSTTNINSGATPGLARYALWYIPVFYPLVIFLVNRSLTSSYFYFRYLILAGLGSYFLINCYTYYPQQPESYTRPSPVSKFIQTYIPSIYDPPKDIFLARFSDSGDSPATNTLSTVVGPSCDKVFIFPAKSSNRISLPAHCFAARDIILQKVAEERTRSLTPRYIRVPGARHPPMLVGTGTYSFRNGDLALSLLGSGWHMSEPWGTWSKAPAVLNVPCALGNESTFEVELSVRPFITSQHPSINLNISSGENSVFKGLLDQNVQQISILLPRNYCDSKNSVAITITADHYRSPKELALSDDERLLGVGLEKIQYPIINK